MAKYAFFDVDNTIYDGYSTSDFCLFLADKNIGPTNLRVLISQINEYYNKGKIDYTQASSQVVQLQATALAGLGVQKVQQFGDEFMKQSQRLFPFVLDLFTLLDKHDFHTYLVSAAASPSIEAVGRYLKTEKYFASSLEIVNGIYTGKVIRVLNNEAKKKTIHKIIDPKTSSGLTLGFGDSTGDIELLSSVDQAFVINPHQQELKEISKNRSWQIVNSRNIMSLVKKTLAKLNN